MAPFRCSHGDRFRGCADHACYHRVSDVSRDGQRFLVVDEGGEAQASRIVIVENWLEELKRRVPARQ